MSVMLLVAVIGTFAPTVMFEMFAEIAILCSTCQYQPANQDLYVSCGSCHYRRPSVAEDEVYKSNVLPFLLTNSALLPIAYVAGAVYMFNTHAMYVSNDALMDQGLSIDQIEAMAEPTTPSKAAGNPHGDVKWTVKQSCAVLLLMIGLFALVAEVLVACLKPALKEMGISEGFAGLTIIAVIPNTTSFVNAVRFSLENRIRLSVEIGSMIASQVGLLQLPVLSLLLLLLPQQEDKPEFTLVFSMLTVFAVILSTMIHIYVLFAGRANYFEGVALMVIYFIWVFAFYFTPDDTKLDEVASSSEISSVDTWI